MRFSGLIAAVILLPIFAGSFGQPTVCEETLTGAFDAIVVEEGSSCILLSVTSNTVTVEAKSTLTAQGISDIGRIDAQDQAVISLKNQTSVGRITPASAASISITAENTAFVESLVLSDGGDTSAQGPYGTIVSMNSGVLNISFGIIRDEFSAQGGVGDVNICGSTIMSETTITGRNGDVTFGNLAGCDGSTFEGAVNVANLQGSISLQSSVVSDLSFGSVTGSVAVTSSSLGTTSVADVSGDVRITTSTANGISSLENIQGALALSRISFFGSVSAVEMAGSVVGPTTIRESSFQDSVSSDVRLDIQERGEVSLASNNFFNGTALLRGNSGPVTFNGNGNVNVSFTQDEGLHIFENSIGDASLDSCTGGVTIENNSFRMADVDSCTGDIQIRRNSFSVLNCTANDPPPVIAENSISIVADGQCAGV